MFSDDVVIKLENISKCYQIYDKPSSRLKQFILPRLGKFLGKLGKTYFREFWALKDISFEIKKGETVGIIGRNGSGKSTLLQILCGTLSPTGGSVQTRGRIAALLELGSGFNPEFTGRDNIYMNATLLGLTKSEIDKRLDEIIAFADIGEHIDQPVKTYSSGMYVRLAFAVIAHVDADILIVDEALSVGDAVFNQKCMRFIRKFQTNGTLLFVSHDMGAIKNLCKQSIWLDKGLHKLSGPSAEVAENYLQQTFQEISGEENILKVIETEASGESKNFVHAQSKQLLNENSVIVKNNISNAKGWKTGDAEIIDVTLTAASKTGTVLEGGELVQFNITARANKNLENPILGFLFKDRLGQDLFGENTLPFTNANPTPIQAGELFSGQFSFKMPLLPNGQYVVMVSVAEGTLEDHVQHHWLHDALIVNIASSVVRWGLVGIEFKSVSLRKV